MIYSDGSFTNNYIIYTLLYFTNVYSNLVISATVQTAAGTLSIIHNIHPLWRSDAVQIQTS